MKLSDHAMAHLMGLHAQGERPYEFHQDIYTSPDCELCDEIRAWMRWFLSNG